MKELRNQVKETQGFVAKQEIKNTINSHKLQAVELGLKLKSARVVVKAIREVRKEQNELLKTGFKEMK